MKERHVIAQLSVYLDGEAAEADAIRDHLDSCPDCARHFEALRAMGTALRDLPQPGPDPRFVGRVLARVAETQPRRIPWLRPAWIGIGALAGVALCVIAWFAAPVGPDSAVHETVAGPVDWTDDEVLVGELARLAEAGADLELLETELVGGEGYPVSLSHEESLWALAQAAAESYASPDPMAQAEADVVLSELTDEEHAALRTLLESSQP